MKLTELGNRMRMEDERGDSGDKGDYEILS